MTADPRAQPDNAPSGSVLPVVASLTIASGTAFVLVVAAIRLTGRGVIRG